MKVNIGETFANRLNDEISKYIDNFIYKTLTNNKNDPVIINENYTKQKFLNTKIKNCPTCGNKVKPIINPVNDGQCTMDCPEITCYYCGTSAGIFWPEEYEKALNAWNSVTKNESFKD